MELSEASRSTAGIIFLTILFVEYGGIFIMRIVRGRHPMTPFQRSFARAGHGHAGVLVILALLAQIFADAADLSGIGDTFARSGIPLAAILMPAGFFLSSAGKDVTRPNRLIVVLYAGVASLSVGVASLGIGLLSSV
jgi:hypothetical protein